MLICNNYTDVAKTGFHGMHTAFVSLVYQYSRSIRVSDDIS